MTTEQAAAFESEWIQCCANDYDKAQFSLDCNRAGNNYRANGESDTARQCKARGMIQRLNAGERGTPVWVRQ